MKNLEIKTDINVFGMQVKTFPDGISETFEAIMAKLPGGFDRSFYGISFMSAEGVNYIAAAEEKFPDEHAMYGMKSYTIEKGWYAAVELIHWREHLTQINEIFHQMMDYPDLDTSKPCIEWYQNNDRMFCMIKKKS